MRCFKSIIVTLFAVLLLSSCSRVAKRSLVKEIEKTNLMLPVTITEGCTFDSMSIARLDSSDLSEEYVVFYYTLSQTMQDLSVGLDLENDNVLAMFISKQSALVTRVVMADMGIATVYKNADTKQVVKSYTIGAVRLKSVRKRLNQGNIKTSSLLESIQLEFDNAKLPVEVNHGVYLVKQYISDDNSICYEYQVGVHETLENLDFSADDIEEERKEVQASLEGDLSLKVQKDEIKEVIPKFVYIYKNLDGVLLYTFSINTSEMWVE